MTTSFRQPPETLYRPLFIRQLSYYKRYMEYRVSAFVCQIYEYQGKLDNVNLNDCLENPLV